MSRQREEREEEEEDEDKEEEDAFNHYIYFSHIDTGHCELDD